MIRLDASAAARLARGRRFTALPLGQQPGREGRARGLVERGLVQAGQGLGVVAAGGERSVEPLEVVIGRAVHEQRVDAQRIGQAMPVRQRTHRLGMTHRAGAGRAANAVRVRRGCLRSH